jgi:hypothetical protein
MKKIILLFCFVSFTANSQVSEYNKGLKKNTLEFGVWFLNKGTESFVTKQNPVGYKRSYDELKKVLNFYNLNIVESEVDESLIDKSVESLNDFKNMSDSLLIEWSHLNMVWRANDKFQINWICGNEMNLILIQKI